jgi:DNA-binding NarL/FixJ family response regulator
VAARIRVILVEDNHAFRHALEELLALRPDMEVVGATGDGGAVVELCRENSPDVVLMDYRLPGLDGVEATAVLKQTFPEIAIVGLTATAGRRERQALLHAGATACLTKDEGLDRIMTAIRNAAESLARAG